MPPRSLRMARSQVSGVFFGMRKIQQSNASFAVRSF